MARRLRIHLVFPEPEQFPHAVMVSPVIPQELHPGPKQFPHVSGTLPVPLQVPHLAMVSSSIEVREWMSILCHPWETAKL